jgi:hypothetical protein
MKEEPKPNFARIVAPRYNLRHIAAALVFLSAGLLTADWSLPPHDQQTARLAIWAIDWYQANLSPVPFVRCRYQVGCSTFAKRAFEKRGFVGGMTDTANRLAHCF